MTAAKLWGFWVGIVALVVLPFLLSSFRLTQLATVGAYFIAILGLDVLAASGQISLGHGAFVAIGAYTTAILMANHGVQDVKTIPIAAAVAGGIGLLAGVPALRIPGLYLALTTFGIALAFPTIPRKFDHFAGGSSGIELLGLPTQTWHGHGYLWLTNGAWLYLLTWTVAVLCFLVAWGLVESRFGQSLRAIRDSELAAAASGLNRAAYKVAAFGISAAFAGAAGALLAINIAHVGPGTFPVALSLFLLVGAVVGLFGSIWGGVLGALLIVYMPDLAGLLPDVHAGGRGPTTFFLGAVLVAAMLAVPVVVRLRRA
jgi:branched-chain amino acid transport system permease protein